VSSKKTHICQLCSAELLGYSTLYKHAEEIHCMSARQYHALEQFPGGIEPTCACGCGEAVSFFQATKTFGRMKRGHISRIKNNWGHNKDALNKSHQTMREKRARGECQAWCKGLTKETDERIASYAKTCSSTIRSNAEEIEQRAERMRRHRLDGTIRSLYGPEHPQWKGGTSSLSGECHGDNRLFKEWKFPKFKAANFKCTRCYSTKNICVHHDKEKMAEIIRMFVSEMKYDNSIINYELKKKVINAVIDYHIQNNVSGIVLCFECHEKEHGYLNYRRKIE